MQQVREELDLPTLEALEEQWRCHPPVHLLVAAYLQYAPPAKAQETGDDDSSDSAGESRPAAWMQGMGAIPGPAAARDAATPEEALQAFEHMFFGEVKDVREI